MNHIIAFIRNIYVRHILLAAVQIGLILALFYGFQYWATDLTKIWNIGFMSEKIITGSESPKDRSEVSLPMEKIQYRNAVPALEEIAPSFRLKGKYPQWIRVKQQFEAIYKRAAHHLQIMNFFYRVYFATIVVSAISSLIAGAFLLIVSKQGWNNVNQYIANILLVMTTQSLFYLALPTMFEHKNNIMNNQKLYLQHVIIYETYLTYLATNLDDKGKKVSLPEYLIRIDDTLSKLSAINLYMEHEKIPNPESLNKALGNI